MHADRSERGHHLLALGGTCNDGGHMLVAHAPGQCQLCQGAVELLGNGLQAVHLLQVGFNQLLLLQPLCNTA